MINSFSSIFEITTALNLAYAGSKVFREALDSGILKLKNVITNNHKEKIEKIQSEINVTIAAEYEGAMQKRCQILDKYFSLNTSKIENLEKEVSDFPIGIKSIFLNMAIFSLSMLVIGGYEEYCDKAWLNIFISFINLSILYNIFVFIRNMLPNKHLTTIKPLVTTIIFCIPILLFFIMHSYFEINNISNYFPSFRYNIAFSLIISISSFLLHFIRVFAHRIYFRYQLLKIFSKTKSDLDDFENSILIILNGNNKKKKKGKSILSNIWNSIKKDKSN